MESKNRFVLPLHLTHQSCQRRILTVDSQMWTPSEQHRSVNLNGFEFTSPNLAVQLLSINL